MQVGVDVKCIHTNFGGRSFSGFGDIATLNFGQIPTCICIFILIISCLFLECVICTCTCVIVVDAVNYNCTLF